MEKIATIADSGFVIALINQDDNSHDSVTEIYKAIHHPILLPQTSLVEIVYLLGRDTSINRAVTFLRHLSKSRFQLTALTSEDVERAAEIIATYADSRFDFVDATVMAIAEREKITTVLTIDKRDFQIFRPQHCEYFTLLPE